MKNRILLFVFVLLTAGFESFAQFEQGQITLGATIRPDIFSYSFYKPLRFDLTPSIGYMAADQLEVGFRSGISLEQHSDYRGIGYNLSPFIRYYSPELLPNLTLFAEGSFRWERWNYINRQDIRDNIRHHSLSFGVGVSYRVAPNIAVEASMRSRHQLNRFSGNSFSFERPGGFNMFDRFNVGFKFFIPTKKTR